MKNENRKSRPFIVEACYAGTWMEVAACTSLVNAESVAHALRPEYLKEGIEVRVRDCRGDPEGPSGIDGGGWAGSHRVDHAPSAAFLAEIARLPNPQDHVCVGDLGSVPL